MVTPHDVLATAESLVAAHKAVVARGTSAAAESLLRTATSRLYYAVYSYAEARAFAQGYEAPAGLGSHDAVWAWYAARGEYAIRRAGKQLKQWRTLADYQLGRDPDWNLDATHAMARDLFARIGALDSSETG